MNWIGAKIKCSRKFSLLHYSKHMLFHLLLVCRSKEKRKWTDLSVYSQLTRYKDQLTMLSMVLSYADNSEVGGSETDARGAKESVEPADSLNKSGQTHPFTYWLTYRCPPSQEMMSGWKQPESVNNKRNDGRKSKIAPPCPHSYIIIIIISRVVGLSVV